MKPAFEPGTGYLKVTLAGKYSLPGLREAIAAIGAEADRGSHARALVDISDLQGEISELDRYDAGVFAAERLGRMERVVVLSGLHFRADHFFENVARNRGLQVRETRDPAEAIAWITSP